MKQVFTALALFTLFAAPAFAEGMHAHKPDAQSGAMQMQTTQTSDLQAQMEKMQGLMERIKSEQNPQTREKLIQEHRAAMEQGMQMMNEDMKKDDQMGSMKPEKRMDMMNDRMDMMQQMMEQMMGPMMDKKGMAGGHM